MKKILISKFKESIDFSQNRLLPINPFSFPMSKSKKKKEKKKDKRNLEN